MAKISSAYNFQYKLVKNIVLSILIPATIILFSAWFFFGGMTIKSAPETTSSTSTQKNGTTEDDLCKGMTQYTCNINMCRWDPTQNMCLASK